MFVDPAIDRCQRYDNQTNPRTDYVIALQADDHGIENVCSYDAGFRPLDFSALPREN